MKAFCLLAVAVMSISGCASAPGLEAGQAARTERAASTKLPTGTLIARSPSDKGSSPLTEANKQVLENERLMNSWKR